MRKAIKWISDKRLDTPQSNLFTLIDDACLKFDLTPKDAEKLLHFFGGQGPGTKEEE